MKRKPGGHPAKQDEATAKLFRDLDGRLNPETMIQLKAAALGTMWVYSDLVGLPAPDAIIGGKQ